MASICPVCSTENRDGANFCKSCGTTLSATASRIPPAPSPLNLGSQADREWATTAPAQLRAPTIPAPLFDLPEPAPSARSFFGRAPAAVPGDERTVILAPGQPVPTPSSISERSERKRARVKVPRTPEPPEPALRRRGLVLWLSLLAVAVVMVIAGWYGYGTRKAAEQAEAPPPPVAVPAPAPAAAPPVAMPPPAESAALPETPAVEATAAEAVPATPAATPKPVAKPPRKQAAATPPSAAPEAPAPAAAPAPPPAAPAAPAEPQALCGDRNFIAKAQCMAAQCVKPEFKAHAQCEAVRRQQRLEEEKRNPTLIN
ncbi:zinc ribbon domain-containing protein [Variovorax sp. IB41]|uniref:zinc ribbon domain-containing protein n=1 Tax=Variovorax sp. IB41 TaxID=2779370 RepID=UPI0018E70431|nr:zinc ribbon domain-containing protein [Variovorax sp. IB41]MBJ2155990.1 zinc ribbon domain-containing protein [Variovorax sp. IB41]